MWVNNLNASASARQVASAGGPPLYVLANPGSGEHDAVKACEIMARIFQEAGRIAEFVPVAGPAGLRAACDLAAARASANGGVLVAVGGDGTINTVARAALRHGCSMGVIPRGTFNLFARDHGIPAGVEEASRALLRAQVQPVQLGWLNDQPFLVNASLGLYPQVLEDREAFKERLGRHRWVAILAGLVTVIQWHRQLTLDIELEDSQVTVCTPTLFVGNNALQLQRIGIDEDALARVGAGHLAMVVVKPLGILAMLGLALRGAVGKLGEAEQVQSLAFRSLTVRLRGGRARAMKVAADGEVYRMTLPLRLSVSPQPLMLLVPCAEDRVPPE